MMLPTLLVVFVMPLLAQSGSAAPRTTLSESEALALVKAAPAFATPARELLRLAKLEFVAEQSGEGWLAEVTWAETGRPRTAVAILMRATPEIALKAVLVKGDWALSGILEGMTIAQLQAAAREARISAFESAARGDILYVLSGQAIYASANKGHFGDLKCLAAPSTCNVAWAGSLLDDKLASLADTFGYRRRFHPGPAVPGMSRSYTSFAYTAVPIQPGETGRSSFCGDDRGKVCVTAGGGEPPVRNGRCGDPCLDGLAFDEGAPPASTADTGALSAQVVSLDQRISMLEGELKAQEIILSAVAVEAKRGEIAGIRKTRQGVLADLKAACQVRLSRGCEILATSR